MEERNIIDLYEGAKDKDLNKFRENVDTTLKVHKDIEKVVKDTDWIGKMEMTVPYIDNIFRNPNRFIINEEEIVRIEKARRVTVESIKHLSRNTNLISKIEKNGDVKPNKILNVNKEEDYNTYENRVIYTLVQNMKSFISRKKKTLEDLSNNQSKKDNKGLEYNGSSKISGHKVDINLTLNSGLDNSGNKNENNELKELLERIADLELKVADLTNTTVYKTIDKKHVSLVTGPIKKTNVILKNVNFQYAMQLWNYLQENIDDKTKSVNDKDDYEDNGELKKLMDDTFFLQYLISNTIDEEEEKENDSTIEKKKEEMNEILISKMLEKIIDMKQDATKEELQDMIGEKYVVIKYKNMITTREIQKVFEEHFDMFLNKINEKEVV